jgi:hypothetical protein
VEDEIYECARRSALSTQLSDSGSSARRFVFTVSVGINWYMCVVGCFAWLCGALFGMAPVGVISRARSLG